MDEVSGWKEFALKGQTDSACHAAIKEENYYKCPGSHLPPLSRVLSPPLSQGPSAPLSRGPSAPPVLVPVCSWGLSEVLRGIVSAPEDGWQGASHCPLDLGQAAAERLADMNYTHVHYADLHYTHMHYADVHYSHV
ncbi:unnamed protein product [Arctogadus glacialis]